MEVFQSFGFGDRAMKEANHMLEICFWEPNEKKEIARSNRIPDTVVGISRFQQVVLHQGRIEQWMTDSINKWSQGKLKVERPKLPVSLDIDESKVDDVNAYPVTVKVKTLSDDEADPEQFGSKIANGLFRQLGGEKDLDVDDNHETEIIHAKYVIGCDGAHSWVRKQLGIEMEGESTDYIWGVLDTVPITNFPDIRNRCAIHSADSGSIMIIPREDGLVRLYIQLRETPRDPSTKSESEAGSNDTAGAKKGRVDRSLITPEVILENARKIFHPYKLDIVDTKWYTAYQIGQRVSPQFHKNNRVFIAGDACHTHSPKAGQGMNVSMMDTYNLAWKVAQVVKGLAKPEILPTYESERRQIARDLINFDYKFSRLFSGKPGEGGISLSEFHQVFEKGNEFASGTIVDYEPSLLVKKPVTKMEKLESENGGRALMDFEFRAEYTTPSAKNVSVGRRLDHAKVVTYSDAKPIWLADRMKSDGRWRVLLFSGDIAKYSKGFDFARKFSDYLLSKDSFVKKYTPATAQLYSVIDVILVSASDRRSVEWNDYPEAFRHKDEVGRMDYWSIYTDEESYHQGHGKIYEKYGICPEAGALLVIRPDGYVSVATEASEKGIKEIEDFFANVLIEQNPSWSSHGFLNSEREELLVDTYGNNDVGFPVLAR